MFKAFCGLLKAHLLVEIGANSELSCAIFKLALLLTFGAFGTAIIT
jgi:hypothetical protein